MVLFKVEATNFNADIGDNDNFKYFKSLYHSISKIPSKIIKTAKQSIWNISALDWIKQKVRTKMQKAI